MLTSNKQTYQVVIVGGGAVGLFLGICLQQAGIKCLILEKRSAVREGSRSLGIHPVSLELFEKLGFANSFVEAGIKITNGHAFANTRKLGTLSFEDCPPPFNYILALPQQKTESLLEQKLSQADPDLLKRGAEVVDIQQSDQQVDITYDIDGRQQTISADFLVGCDGKNSFVRDEADICFEGKAYPDTYIMGDFSDNTDFGSDAAIFLCDQGLIESFPLLNNQRRWVVKTDQYIPEVNRTDIEQRVQQRISHNLRDESHTMLSSFGVQKLVAKPMVQDRIILAGDAAHVISPIGGQGMNLGWLGAWDLAHSLKAIFETDQRQPSILDQFKKRRKKATRNAIQRAEMNMRLGRRPRFPALRNALVSLMLKTPLSQLMARVFTMRGIERWII